MAEPRVMIADDHPLFRDGLVMALSRADEFRIVAEVADGEEALATIRSGEPDIALVDVDMPVVNGVEIAKTVEREGLPCRIIFVTMHKHPTLVRKSVEAGIAGYLLKDSAATEIVDAVRAVAAGGNYFSPPIASIIVNQTRSEQSSAAGIPGLASLTPAERKVLRLVASDRTSKEIAGELGVSVRTIETHRSRITKKLGLSGAHSLVKFAFEHRDSL